jgi:plastocyanin
MTLGRMGVGLALALSLAASSACGGAAASTSTNHIDLPRSYLFAPADITVKAGATVTWTNSDQFTHSVRLVDTGEVLGVLRPGETLTHVFDMPGIYKYDCSFHPQNMHGTVTVTTPQR